MAGRKVKKNDTGRTGAGKAKAEWKGYVNWSSDRVDKAGFDKWAESNEPFGNMIPTLIEDGYKVSMSYDNHNASAVASLYCQDVGNENAGWCLTARGSHVYDALLRLLYIHFVCFEKVWPEDDTYASDSWGGR